MYICLSRLRSNMSSLLLNASPRDYIARGENKYREEVIEPARRQGPTPSKRRCGVARPQRFLFYRFHS